MSERSILIVDDEPDIRDILSQLLMSEGYMVKAASSGWEAVDLMRGGNFSLVITDIRLPDISGIEVLRSARALLKGAPVIVITGFAAAESAIHALKLGAYDYITKPLNLDEVILSVRRAIKLSETQSGDGLRKEVLREISGHILPHVRKISSSLDRINGADPQLPEDVRSELDSIRFSLNEIRGVLRRLNTNS